MHFLLFQYADDFRNIIFYRDGRKYNNSLIFVFRVWLIIVKSMLRLRLKLWGHVTMEFWRLLILITLLIWLIFKLM